MITQLNRRTFIVRLGGFVVASLLSVRHTMAGIFNETLKKGKKMKLPQPKIDGAVSLESTIQSRRTTRSYTRKCLTLEQLSQLLWSAQGITGKRGFKRAAPSGGALYPMDIYAVVGKGCVQGIAPGVWHYNPRGNEVFRVSEEDRRQDLARASLSQMWMAEAPLNLVITVEYSRITSKYGDRGVRYAMIEAGHIGQNIFLQAEAMGLKAGIVGAFHDREITRMLETPRSHEPLLVMPVGYGS